MCARTLHKHLSSETLTSLHDLKHFAFKSLVKFGLVVFKPLRNSSSVKARFTLLIKHKIKALRPFNCNSELRDSIWVGVTLKL